MPKNECPACGARITEVKKFTNCSNPQCEALLHCKVNGEGRLKKVIIHPDGFRAEKGGNKENILLI